MVGERAPTICVKIRIDVVAPSAKNAEPEADLLGACLADVYTVEAVIGRGGMGIVYRARHIHLQKAFAIKVLLEQCADDVVASQRLLQEARAASHIDHPNVVGVVNCGMLSDGRVFIVMEMLAGHDLATELAEGPLDFLRAKTIVTEVCKGVHAAHESGILHRDLKPENIFICEGAFDGDAVMSGGVKVLDFGISRWNVGESGDDVRLTRTDQLLGTPLYMSPEQARGGEATARSDLYALAVIFYEMLEGRPPFAGSNPYELLWQHGHEPAPRLSQPPAQTPKYVQELIAQTLAKDSMSRPADMMAFMRALNTPPPSRRRAIRAAVRPSKSKVLAAIGVAGLLVGIVLSIVALKNNAVALKNNAAIPKPSEGSIAEVTLVQKASPIPKKEVQIVERKQEQPTVSEHVIVCHQDPCTVSDGDQVLGLTPLTVRVPSGQARVVHVARAKHSTRRVDLSAMSPARLRVELQPARPRVHARSGKSRKTENSGHLTKASASFDD